MEAREGLVQRAPDGRDAEFDVGVTAGERQPGAVGVR